MKLPVKESARPFPAIDAHLDLGYYLRRERSKGRHSVVKADYAEDFARGNVKAIISAIYVDELAEPGSALRQACEEIAAIQAEEKESAGVFCICKSFSEMETAIEGGKVAILLSFEGAEPLGQNPDMLDFFYNAGVRGLGLAHARRNQACDGARYTSSAHNLGCGLTDLGVELIKRAEARRMIIDVSHLNDAGTNDVLSLVSRPVIASHSNCRALNPTLRNLTDEHIRAIANTGGVIGINGCNAIISDDPNADIMEAMLRHVDHLVAVGGIEHVGLGFDIAEMILSDGVICVNGVSVPVRDTVPNYAALCGFAESLEKRGYGQDAIEKIFFGNFRRALRDILG